MWGGGHYVEYGPQLGPSGAMVTWVRGLHGKCTGIGIGMAHGIRVQPFPEVPTSGKGCTLIPPPQPVPREGLYPNTPTPAGSQVNGSQKHQKASRTA